MKSKGFTLIELLVVISILGVLAGLIVNNLNDSRARARDARKKQNLNQMKTALRLYYNDYQGYPTASDFGGCGENRNYIMGCGENGDECCPCSDELAFAAGGSDCDTTYMASFPTEFGTNIISYYSADSESFCLKADLENASDPDIATSAEKCNSVCSPVIGRDLQSPEYAVCSD